MEFTLWEAVQNNGGLEGRYEVSAAEAQLLWQLANQAGGWYAWDNKTEDTFVPMTEWQQRFAAWKTSGAQPGELNRGMC